MKKNINTPYDNAFRTMLNDCTRLLIPVVNEVFGKNYGRDEIIKIYSNEHFIHNKGGRDEKRITDSFFTIGSDKYILECQSTIDNTMIVRIFEYAVHAAIDSADTSVKDILEMTIPNIAVLYLRSDKTTPGKMKILLHTPNGDFEFYAPTIKIQDYTLEDLFSRKLYFLLPFYTFNHEKNFAKYNSDPVKLEAFKQECIELLMRLEQAKSAGELYQIDVVGIRAMSQTVLNGLAAKYKNIMKGVDFNMGGKILDYEGKNIFREGERKGQLEGINQANKRMATDMLQDGEPLEKIIRYSRLAKDVILNMAKSLGVSVAY